VSLMGGWWNDRGDGGAKKGVGPLPLTRRAEAKILSDKVRTIVSNLIGDQGQCLIR